MALLARLRNNSPVPSKIPLAFLPTRRPSTLTPSLSKALSRGWGMFASTTVPSILSFRPRVALCSTARATARSLRRSSVSGPTSFAQRMRVVSSGAASRYSRQNCLKTSESETLRSVASKLQP